MRTQVFKGTETEAVTVAIGYDDTGYDSTAFDGTEAVFSTVSKYNLSRPVGKLDYLYVTADISGNGFGVHLNPNVDYVMVSDTVLELGAGIGITPSSIITVTHFLEDSQKPSIGFRIFKDMNDNVGYYRINESATTTLAADLAITDEVIHLVDASVLPEPDAAKGMPGEIMVGGERIVYYARDIVNNTIGQLRRGTKGTGMISLIPAGTLVQDAGLGQVIPNAHSKIWYDQGSGTASNGFGLQNSHTEQALFLLAGPAKPESEVFGG
jgi:hypothetical protein